MRLLELPLHCKILSHLFGAAQRQLCVFVILLLITYYLLLITYYLLLIAYCLLLIAYCLLVSPDFLRH